MRSDFGNEDAKKENDLSRSEYLNELSSIRKGLKKKKSKVNDNSFYPRSKFSPRFAGRYERMLQPRSRGTMQLIHSLSSIHKILVNEQVLFYKYSFLSNKLFIISVNN